MTDRTNPCWKNVPERMFTRGDVVADARLTDRWDVDREQNHEEPEDLNEHLARVLPMAHTDTSRRRLAVGVATHDAIARVLSGERPANTAQRVRLSREAAGSAVDKIEAISQRRPYAKAQVATGVGVYLAKFLPDEPWEFAGSEIPLAGCRLDLLWQNTQTGGVLIDEIKMSAGRDLLEAYHPQVSRQLAAGHDTFGDRLVGLRLLSLAAPRDSRFYVHDRRYVFAALDQTPFWQPGGDVL